MKQSPATILLSLLLGCGSVVTEPGLTGGSSSGGAGGGATASSSSGTTGACAVTCPSCTPFTPWSKAITIPGPGAGVMLGRFMMPDGSTILPVDQQLVKFDRDGQVLWQIDGGHVDDVVPDDGCGMFVVGRMALEDTALFGQPISCPAAECNYIGRLDASGVAIWLRVLDPGQSASPHHLEAGGGRLVVTGSFQGTIDVGSGPVVAPSDGHPSLFLATFSGDDGHALWTRMLRFPEFLGGVGGVAMSPAGDVVLAEFFRGSLDFGDGVLHEPEGCENVGCGFVASYDASGSLRFGKTFGGPNGTVESRLRPAIDAVGDIIVGGAVYGTIDFGGGLLGAPWTKQVMIVKLNANGDHVFSEALATFETNAHPIAVDAQNRIGVYVGHKVIVLDAAGAVLAEHSFAGSGGTIPSSVGFDPDGALMIAGIFHGTIDLGQGPLSSSDKWAVYVGALAP